MNEKELFENLCFLPDWSVDDAAAEKIQEAQEIKNYVPQRKDLSTLLAELEEIKNNIENIKAKEWHLAKLIKFHKEGVAFQ